MLKFFKSLKFRLLALMVSIASSFQFAALAKLDVKIESEKNSIFEEKKYEFGKTTLTLQYNDNYDADKRELAAYAILAILNSGFKKRSSGKFVSYSFEKDSLEGSRFVINFDSSEVPFLLNLFSGLYNFFYGNNNDNFNEKTNIGKRYLYDAIFGESYGFQNISEFFKFKKGYFKDFLKTDVSAQDFISNLSIDTLKNMLEKVQEIYLDFPKISNLEQEKESVEKLWTYLGFLTSSEKKRASSFRFDEGLLSGSFGDIKTDLFGTKKDEEDTGYKILGRKKAALEDYNLKNKQDEDPYVLVADVLKEIVSVDGLRSIVEQRKGLFEEKSHQEQKKEYVENARKLFEKKKNNGGV